MAYRALCCCFSNNVRHLVLCLSIVCATTLFANLTLFNVVVIVKKDIPFSYRSYEYKLFDLKLSRSPRDLSNETDVQVTTIPDKSYSSAKGSGFSEELKLDSNSSSKPTSSLEVEGHPVISVEEDSLTKKHSTTVPTSTSTTPKTIFLTRPTFVSNSLTSSSKTVSSTDSSAIEKANDDGTASADNEYSVTKVTKKLNGNTKPSHTTEGLLTILSDKVNEFNNATNLNMKPLLVWVTPGFGMFFGTLLSAWLIKPLGVRKLVPVALVICSFATLTLGFVLLYGFSIMAVSIIRFIQGLSCGTVLPVIGSMTANWATLKEQYCFIVFGHLFVQLVPLACWPFSSWLLKLEFTLPFIFYATIAVIFAAVWVLFYRDRPQYHRLVNGLELNKIVTGKIKAISNRSVKKKSLGMVISSLPVWAVWISAFSYFVVIALILQYLPIYCHIILKMEDPTPEIAMAFSLMLIMTLLYPIWIRIARKSGEKMSISLFNLISFIVIGVAFIFIGLSPKNSVISRGAFIVTLIALVLSFYGFYRSAIFVGRYYAKYIISYAENSFAVAFIFVSFLVYFLDNPEGFNEWRVVFITVSLVQFITAAVFCILGSWKPEEWSKQTWNPSVGRRLVSVDQIDFHNEECGFIEMKII